MITKYFSVHNLVNIKVETIFKEKIEHIKFSLREFEIDHIDEKDINIFIYDYKNKPKFENPIVVQKDYAYENNYIDFLSIQSCFNIIDSPFRIYCNDFKISFSFFVEIFLLKKGYSLIHASAVQYNERCFLFPALGGVGKTATLSGIVKNGGKLFGDDFVIMGNNKILSYPIDFSIYEYHLKILEIKNKKLKFKFLISSFLDFPIRFLNNFNNRPSRLLKMIFHSLKIKYIHFSPRFLFGENNIIKEGSVNEVYFLQKKDNNKKNISIKEMDFELLSERCTNILFHEWQESFSLLYVYSVFSSFSVNNIFNSIKNIIKNEMNNYNLFEVEIPYNLNYQVYLSQIIKILDKD